MSSALLSSTTSLSARSAPHVSRRRRPPSASVSVSRPTTSQATSHVDQSHQQDLRSRPRRNRRTQGVRDALSETQLGARNLILPVFVHDEGDEVVAIESMPGQYRQPWRTGLLEVVGEAVALGVRGVVIFPKVDEALKSETGDECFNENGLVHNCVRLLKERYPSVTVYTDVALDPYSSAGHDGIVDRASGTILNDETVAQLCKQAVSHARAGADVVAPSDMMDGRIGAIRDALDDEGFTEVGIMAYTAKYASAFYGPFRDALDSKPVEGDGAPKDKKTYQMDPRNYREALRELDADEAEGADIVMVKPGLPYLDVIRLLRDSTSLPVAAYHVSGEYAMLKAAAQNGWLDEKASVLEALTCVRRAGADLILTYYAMDVARWLREDRD